MLCVGIILACRQGNVFFYTNEGREEVYKSQNVYLRLEELKRHGTHYILLTFKCVEL